MNILQIQLMLAIEASINAKFSTVKKCQSPKLRALNLFSAYNIKQIRIHDEAAEIDRLLGLMVEDGYIHKLSEDEKTKYKSRAELFQTTEKFEQKLLELRE